MMEAYRLTAQEVSEEKATCYSKPIDKITLVKMLVPFMFTTENESKLSNKERNELCISVASRASDEAIVRSFNKKMDYRVKSFAPGLFVVQWDNIVRMGHC